MGVLPIIAVIVLITTTVGLGVYGIKALLPDVPIQNIFKWTGPFVIADIIHALILLFVPAISLFLPNLIGGR